MFISIAEKVKMTVAQFMGKPGLKTTQSDPVYKEDRVGKPHKQRSLSPTPHKATVAPTYTTVSGAAAPTSPARTRAATPHGINVL